MKKILAFTLAETLIVMGIIGVVAALTLPNLNSSTGDKEKVAKLQKIYSNLSDAVGRTQAVYGPRTGWTNKSFADRMEDFLKISKKCTGPRTDNCFTKTEKCLSGTDCKRGITEDCWSYDNGSYILADGTSIFVFGGCSSGYSPLGIGVFVDIDGPRKGSNTWGKDLFAFQIPADSTELITDEVSFRSVSTDTDLKNNCFISGASCATWVIQNGNMDYLKATNGTCSNGTVLSWSNTTCK